MNIRKILDEINSGELTEEQALEIVDAILDSDQAGNVEKLLDFSRVEWTGFGQGAELGVLANWRKNGWPKVCISCGKEINVPDFGWWIKSNDGESVLKHIKCPE